MSFVSKALFAATLILAVACERQAAGQDISALDTINEKLAHIVSADAKAPEVQVVTLPAAVDWGPNGGDYQFYSLCDDLSVWGPTIKTSGTTVSGRYYQFLTGIKTKDADPSADKKQREAAAKAQHWADVMKTDQDKLLTDWNELAAKEAHLPTESRTSYAYFKRMHGAQVSSDQISYRAALGEWVKYAAAAAPSGVGQALNTLMQSLLTNVMTYGGSPDTAYPCYPQIDIPAALADAKSYQGEPDLNLSFTHHTARKDESYESWGGGGGWGPFSVNVHHERHDVHTQDQNFALSLVAPKLIKFDVRRPWLDLNLVNTYQNEEIYPDSELKKNVPLWGEKGSFALVSQTFVVAYHPKVTVKMSSNDYKSFHEAFTGGGSIAIGPFHADANGTGGVNIESWDDSTSTVVVGTSVNSFVLIGVINKIMPGPVRPMPTPVAQVQQSNTAVPQSPPTHETVTPR